MHVDFGLIIVPNIDRNVWSKIMKELVHGWRG